MAFNIFSIPVMSSKVKRVFSAAKRFITDKQNCLRAEVIKTSKYQRHWLKADLVNSSKFQQILIINELNILPFVLSATISRHIAKTTP